LKPKVYLETSVISYLAGRISRDPISAANQHQTRVWWNESRFKFDLCTSQAVLLEVGAGDPVEARSRLALVEEIPRLDVTSDCFSLADDLLRGTGLSRKARLDALHVAVAAMGDVDFLLTWNCRHIANAVLIPRMTSIIMSRGFRCPLICNPPQLMGL
jgi:hypothetical protein